MPTIIRSLASRALLVLASCAGGALAQDLTIKAPPQAQAVVIQNATVHPVSGPPIERGVVVFNDGLIRGVMTGEEWAKAQSMILLSGPPRVIDASGLHVYPGLISPYTQLGLSEIQAVAASVDVSETGNVSPEVRASIAVNPDSVLLPVTRRSGILTVGVFPEGGLIPGRASAIRLDGWSMEDVTIESDLGVILRWPNVRPISAWWMDRSEEDQLKDIRESLEAIRRVFDTAQSYAVQREVDPSTPIDLRWEAMRGIFPPAQAEGTAQQAAQPAPPRRPVFVLAQDADQITGAVRFLSERGVRCVVVGGRDADKCADLLRTHDVPVIIRGVQNMPRRDDSAYDEPFTLPKRLADAGLIFAASHSDDTAHERNLPYALGTAVAYGLSKDAALRSATLGAARTLGLEGQLGSLEVGKRATLLITTGDPLEVTSDVVRAFIDGREIDMRNKQTEMAQKYLERYRQMGVVPRPQEPAQPPGQPPAVPDPTQ